MNAMEQIYAKAKRLQRTVVLPEADDDRTLQAAAMAADEGFGQIILLGAPDKLTAQATKLGISIAKAKIVDPQTDPNRQFYIDTFTELRKDKGMTPEKAAKTLEGCIYYAAMMVKTGHADGYVSGAVHSTADTLRPALQIIKAAKGIKTVSAFFLMILPDSSPYAKINNTFMYGDSGLVQNPSVEELADIAIGTANSWRQLIGTEPKVAMLSHSTKGSAKHPDVDKVVAATQLVKEKCPDLQIDGELQADAAIIPDIGQRKAPGSTVAGHANVLIFPDLDAGNIAYKLTERLAGASATGPLVAGLSLPANDLSRGCNARDIVSAIAVTACQKD